MMSKEIKTPVKETPKQETPETPVVPIVKSDSETLAGLKKDYSAKWAAMLKFTDPFAPEAHAAKAEAYKAQLLVDGQIAKEKNEEIAALEQEKRNARIGLLTTLEDAILTAVGVKRADLSADQLASFTAHHDIVSTELLAKFPVKAAKTTATNGNGNGNGQTKGEQIVEAYKNYRLTMDDSAARKQLIADGFNDGTMGIAVRAYQVSIGEKQ